MMPAIQFQPFPSVQNGMVPKINSGAAAPIRRLDRLDLGPLEQVIGGRSVASQIEHIGQNPRVLRRSGRPRVVLRRHCRMDRRRQNRPFIGMDVLDGRIEQLPTPVQQPPRGGPLGAFGQHPQEQLVCQLATPELLLPREITQYETQRFRILIHTADLLNQRRVRGADPCLTVGNAGPRELVSAELGRQRPLLVLPIGQRPAHLLRHHDEPAISRNALAEPVGFEHQYVDFASDSEVAGP